VIGVKASFQTQHSKAALSPATGFCFGDKKYHQESAFSSSCVIQLVFHLLRQKSTKSELDLMINSLFCKFLS
jgi:hypothetical protein